MPLSSRGKVRMVITLASGAESVTGAPASSPADPEEAGAGSLPELLHQYLNTAVLALDERRQIVAYTTETALLLGLSVDQALHHPIDVLPAALREVLRKALASGEPLAETKVLLSNPSGPPITLRVATTFLWNKNRQPAGLIAVLNNVGPAREFDTNLRRIDRLASVGTLSASMAHEVKNAMVAVKTFVDLLIKKNQDADLAEIVEREMRRIDSIVSQMLRFSGPARPTFGNVQLHQVLEQSLLLVQHHLEGRKIQLVREFRATPDVVRGDAYQLEQAFLNLFFNALEAMGAQGELKITTDLISSEGKEDPRGSILKVRVQDNGAGISPEHLARLFEPFFTTKANGTGLGLPITRRIIQEHRGSITAESQLHHGTTFTLLLPSAAKQP